MSIRPVLTEELRSPAPQRKARENAYHSKTKVMHLFKIRSDAVFRSICIVCPFLLLHRVTICPIYQHASFWHIRATPTLLHFCAGHLRDSEGRIRFGFSVPWFWILWFPAKRRAERLKCSRPLKKQPPLWDPPTVGVGDDGGSVFSLEA